MKELAIILLLFSHTGTASESSNDGLLLTKRALQPLCSCSPTQYIFELAFKRGACIVDEIGSLPGIQQTTCINFGGITTDEVDASEYEAATADILASIPWIDIDADQTLTKQEKKKLIKLQNENESRNVSKIVEMPGTFQESIRLLQSTEVFAIVNSIQFIEINAFGIILQDVKQSFIPGLVDGDDFSFTSASSLLRASLPLTIQENFIPETTVLFIEGLNSEGQLMLTRLAWRFGNGCDVGQHVMQGGEGLGVVDFGELTNAPGIFCPANSSPDYPPTLPPTRHYAPNLSPNLPTLPPNPPIINETPTDFPIVIEYFPTESPAVSSSPSAKPTRRTKRPKTNMPTRNHTVSPSISVTRIPTISSVKPTMETRKPNSSRPSFKPTRQPKTNPTRRPTPLSPTIMPTERSTPKPTPKPTQPSVPSYQPTIPHPSYLPTTSTLKPVESPEPTEKIRRPTRQPRPAYGTPKPTPKRYKLTEMPSYLPTSPYPSYIPTSVMSKPATSYEVLKPTKHPYGRSGYNKHGDNNLSNSLVHHIDYDNESKTGKVSNGDSTFIIGKSDKRDKNNGKSKSGDKSSGKWYGSENHQVSWKGGREGNESGSKSVKEKHR